MDFFGWGFGFGFGWAFDGGLGCGFEEVEVDELEEEAEVLEVEALEVEAFEVVDLVIIANWVAERTRTLLTLVAELMLQLALNEQLAHCTLRPTLRMKQRSNHK